MKHKLTKQEIFTIPNALSLFRILLIPLIVWLYVAREQRYAAVGLVALSGLTGDVNLACYMQGMAYSARAVEEIEFYNANGGTLTYALIDADGNVTEDPENAVFIQFVEYGQTEYWVFGHVVYKDFVNGFANIEIDVADGSEWRVADASTISKLVIEPGAAVYGELTENEDGTITITASENTIPSGEYGFFELEEAVSSGSGEASGGASGEAS